MRKILGFLVAAAVVATVAGSAMAQTAITLTSTNPAAGLGQKASFQAEVTFTLGGSFGFVLKRAADNALPASSDTGAVKVDWFQTSAPTTLITGVAPGAAGFINSQVYAEVTNELSPGTAVQFYTENTSAAAGEYSYGVGFSTTDINPLVESAGGVGTANNGLPLAYVFVSSETVFDVNVSTHLTAAGSVLSNIAGVHIMDNMGDNQSLYAWFVKDKAREGADGYSKIYATIALNTATGVMGNGNRVLARPAVQATPGTPSGEYWYVAADKAFMFFSTSFAQAVGGFKYGTNTLTLEMTVDANY
ncbi:MAG: hypothetical protein FWG57_05960 [Endomicrobia bacterium]|nr:hypothetical protein [Endomicrobiia bacterium]